MSRFLPALVVSLHALLAMVTAYHLADILFPEDFSGMIGFLAGGCAMLPGLIVGMIVARSLGFR